MCIIQFQLLQGIFFYGLCTHLQKECHSFPHQIITPSYSTGGVYRYKGKCEFDLALDEDTWTVNITFDKDIFMFEFWIANQISIHPNGRWICVTNKYLQSTPRTVDLMFHADFSGAQEPSGNCFVLNNNQTDCLSYDLDLTTVPVQSASIRSSSTMSTSTTPATNISSSTTSSLPTSSSTTSATTTSSSTTSATTTSSSTTRATTTSSSTTRATTTSSSTSSATTASPLTTLAATTSPLTTFSTTTSPPNTSATTTSPFITSVKATSPSTTLTSTRFLSIVSSSLQSSPATLSSTESITTTLKTHTCNCTISTVETLSEEEFSDILRSLTVNKTTLSATRRGLTSAPDDRPLSKGIGMVGIAFLCSLVGLLLFFDLSNLRNCNRKVAMMRNK